MTTSREVRLKSRPVGTPSADNFELASVTLPAPEGGPVLDTTGAGDAFNAGFLVAWLAEASREQALAEGIACGTLSVRSVGGAGMRLDRADVDAMSQNLLHSDDRIDA